MDHIFCVSVRNNWDKYVTFCQKESAKSVTFYLVRMYRMYMDMPKIVGCNVDIW